MANRLFTSQFYASFELQSVHLMGAFTQSGAAGQHASLVNQGVTYTAVAFGPSGNAITIALVDPGAPSQSLSISVTGNAITANLATDSMSAITTTASTLITAIQASMAASALVSVAGSGSSPLTALSATPLAGGANTVFTNNLRIPYMSLTQTDVGEYQLALQDKYPALMSANISLVSASAADLSAQLATIDVSGAQIITFRTYAIGSGSPVATSMSDGNQLLIDLCLRNVV